MPQIDSQYILSMVAKDKLKSYRLISKRPDYPEMDNIQTLPFPQLYPNNSFDIIPIQFNTMELITYLDFNNFTALSLYV